jgi:hypothetical protein
MQWCVIPPRPIFLLSRRALISIAARLSGWAERQSAHAQRRLDRDRPDRDLRVGGVRAVGGARALSQREPCAAFRRVGPAAVARVQGFSTHGATRPHK